MVRPTKLIEPINASMEDVARALLRPKKKEECDKSQTEPSEKSTIKTKGKRAKTGKSSTGKINPSKKS